ncbi:hypothetical protein AB4543_20450 [Vibrio splendidus]
MDSLLLEIPDISFLSSGMTISNCISSFPKATKEHNRESRLDSLLLEIPDTSFLSSGMTISNCISSFPKATKGHNKESRLDSIAIRDSRYFAPQFWNDDF